MLVALIGKSIQPSWMAQQINFLTASPPPSLFQSHINIHCPISSPEDSPISLGFTNVKGHNNSHCPDLAITAPNLSGDERNTRPALVPLALRDASRSPERPLKKRKAEHVLEDFSPDRSITQGTLGTTPSVEGHFSSLLAQSNLAITENASGILTSPSQGPGEAQLPDEHPLPSTLPLVLSGYGFNGDGGSEYVFEDDWEEFHEADIATTSMRPAWSDYPEREDVMQMNLRGLSQDKQSRFTNKGKERAESTQTISNATNWRSSRSRTAQSSLPRSTRVDNLIQELFGEDADSGYERPRGFTPFDDERLRSRPSVPQNTPLEFRPPSHSPQVRARVFQDVSEGSPWKGNSARNQLPVSQLHHFSPSQLIPNWPVDQGSESTSPSDNSVDEQSLLSSAVDLPMVPLPFTQGIKQTTQLDRDASPPMFVLRDDLLGGHRGPLHTEPLDVESPKLTLVYTPPLVDSRSSSPMVIPADSHRNSSPFNTIDIEARGNLSQQQSASEPLPLDDQLIRDSSPGFEIISPMALVQLQSSPIPQALQENNPESQPLSLPPFISEINESAEPILSAQILSSPVAEYQSSPPSLSSHIERGQQELPAQYQSLFTPPPDDITISHFLQTDSDGLSLGKHHPKLKAATASSDNASSVDNFPGVVKNLPSPSPVSTYNPSPPPDTASISRTPPPRATLNDEQTISILSFLIDDSQPAPVPRRLPPVLSPKYLHPRTRDIWKSAHPNYARQMASQMVVAEVQPDIWVWYDAEEMDREEEIDQLEEDEEGEKHEDEGENQDQDEESEEQDEDDVESEENDDAMDEQTTEGVEEKGQNDEEPDDLDLLATTTQFPDLPPIESISTTKSTRSSPRKQAQLIIHGAVSSHYTPNSHSARSSPLKLNEVQQQATPVLIPPGPSRKRKREVEEESPLASLPSGFSTKVQQWKNDLLTLVKGKIKMGRQDLFNVRSTLEDIYTHQQHIRPSSSLGQLVYQISQFEVDQIPEKDNLNIRSVAHKSVRAWSLQKRKT
ncbi:hypothetical protein CPB83DRAFT_857335 [Crepidotus variabilis]|uniref:Uncharacterized protein n=1 Tax=Crepidotus variabilis TaxID=179855 RepID=A0A9P6ED23_9AGAR|nr:hypothetical protein CPB83DRAFT_857335 [Crepidotus variabilis]